MWINHKVYKQLFIRSIGCKLQLQQQTCSSVHHVPLVSWVGLFQASNRQEISLNVFNLSFYLGLNWRAATPKHWASWATNWRRYRPVVWGMYGKFPNFDFKASFAMKERALFVCGRSERICAYLSWQFSRLPQQKHAVYLVLNSKTMYSDSSNIVTSLVLK